MKREGKRARLNIHINFTNRAIYTFVAFIILLIIGVTVYAFGTSTPSTFGHSAGELDLSAGVSGNAIFNDNVGIGTASPTEKLDVAGNIKASGIVCDSIGCIGSGGLGAGDVSISGDLDAPNLIRDSCSWSGWGCGSMVCSEGFFVAGINFNPTQSEGCWGFANDFDEPKRRIYCCKL